MERESFEDPELAAYLNAHYISIKVDREELPDVDHVYMSALQAMTGSGGWPMNMFLLPDQRAFFGGTYWPVQDRPNYPSFKRVLVGVKNAWDTQRENVLENAQQLTDHLRQQLTTTSAGLPDNLHDLSSVARTFDIAYGGFGGAPKFPNSPSLLYLLAQAWLGDPKAYQHLALTLDRMMEGGIYDQVGGGFHRYAVDAVWQVPHFEKMLYDNAQLARVYLGASRLPGLERFERVACETLDYLLREMASPEGGFYSAQDADSEGLEGKFYVWSEAEIEAVLGADAPAAKVLFGVSAGGNWEGSNILRQTGQTSQPNQSWIKSVRDRLYAVRKNRTWPITDDKILADWNGLALRAFAEAGRILGENRYLEAARANARFVQTMYQDGLLRHVYRGQLKPQAYLSDQANYGLGLLELYQATAEPQWAEAAVQMAGSLQRFRDPSGGFYDSLPELANLVIPAKERTLRPQRLV
jgi:uncharacterized protein